MPNETRANAQRVMSSQTEGHQQQTHRQKRASCRRNRGHGRFICGPWHSGARWSRPGWSIPSQTQANARVKNTTASAAGGHWRAESQANAHDDDGQGRHRMPCWRQSISDYLTRPRCQCCPRLVGELHCLVHWWLDLPDTCCSMRDKAKRARRMTLSCALNWLLSQV